MKVFVVLVAVLGTTLAASLREPVDKTSNGLTGNGDASVGTRIVGGYDTTVEQYQYIGQLELDGSLYCGFSIITRTKVVFANHCTYEGFLFFYIQIPYNRLRIRAGTSATGSGGQIIPLASLVRHPGFTMYTLKNDIALGKLASSLSLVPGVAPIVLPISSTDPEVVVGAAVRVSGWGLTNENATVLPSTLQTVVVNIVASDVCNAAYGNIDDNMICAGVEEGGKDSCSGDSGGPIVYENGSPSPILIGVVSFGNGCARKGYPGVYTKVSKFLDFINNNAN